MLLIPTDPPFPSHVSRIKTIVVLIKMFVELSRGGNVDNSQHMGIINEAEQDKHEVEINKSIFTQSRSGEML